MSDQVNSKAASHQNCRHMTQRELQCPAGGPRNIPIYVTRHTFTSLQYLVICTVGDLTFINAKAIHRYGKKLCLVHVLNKDFMVGYIHSSSFM